MIARPFLAQAQATGPDFGDILLGILILAALAFIGSRIISRGGGPRPGA